MYVVISQEPVGRGVCCGIDVRGILTSVQKILGSVQSTTLCGAVTVYMGKSNLLRDPHTDHGSGSQGEEGNSQELRENLLWGRVEST